MKRIIKLALCIFAIGAFMQANAQVNQKPTTEEEYNYLTKGYKIQIESGLDMKKGYTLQDVTPGYSLYWTDSKVGKIERNVKFKALVRDGEEKPCAMLIILKRIDTKSTTYLCVPSYDADSELWDRVYSEWKNLEDFQRWVILYAMNHLTSYYFSY